MNPDYKSINYSTTNGIDTPNTERSRSPSPTLDGPFFNPVESFGLTRPQNNYSSFENNGQNDIYAINYGSDISQILKEVNSINNVLEHANLDVKTADVS